MSLKNKMLEIARLENELNKLKEEVSQEVLELGKSQKIEEGGLTIRATYSKGRKTVNYKDAGRTIATHLDDDTVDDYRKTEINYSQIAKDLIDEYPLIIDQNTSYGKPSVSIKVKVDEESDKADASDIPF